MLWFCSPIGGRYRCRLCARQNGSRAIAFDVVVDEFVSVAAETGLIADLGRHGVEDIAHTIDRAMRGLDPIGKQRKKS
jgi:hypothetical protein